jgi:hypothetical protein
MSHDGPVTSILDIWKPEDLHFFTIAMAGVWLVDASALSEMFPG